MIEKPTALDEFDLSDLDDLEIPDVEIENNQPKDGDDGCEGGACKI